MKTASDPRHQERQTVIQEVFAWEAHQKSPDKTAVLLSPKAKKVVAALSEIDAIIKDCAPEWEIDRINQIDLATLRLGVYELVIEPTAPAKVVIDEAVELAKEFGSENSPGFVNGALGKALLMPKRVKIEMPDLKKVQENLGVAFKDEKLLTTSLTHRSYLNEVKTSHVSNERLEFLGDSVLSLLVSTELYTKFEHYPEGKLTSFRSLLVKTKTLGDLSKKLHLGEFLLMSKGEEKSGGRNNSSLLADTFEAVLGAIYIDKGLAEANHFLTKNLFPLISEVEKNTELLDYKSSLQEEVQEKQKTSPTYAVLNEIGPDHDKIFTIGVLVDNKLLAKGRGRSKQEAEQEAARLALENSKG